MGGMHARLALALTLALVVAACSAGSPGTSGQVPDLPEAGVAEFGTILAADPRPTVANVWASWCGPCRAEAPLLARAWESYGDQVRFVGINVRDAQTPAKGFIETYGLHFEHVFDRTGAIPAQLGGFGVPITYFIAADGTVVGTHSGIIDERSLVEAIDDLLMGG